MVRWGSVKRFGCKFGAGTPAPGSVKRIIYSVAFRSHPNLGIIVQLCPTSVFFSANLFKQLWITFCLGSPLPQLAQTYPKAIYLSAHPKIFELAYHHSDGQTARLTALSIHWVPNASAWRKQTDGRASGLLNESNL